MSKRTALWRISLAVIGSLALAIQLARAVPPPAQTSDENQTEFTGEILPVLYVRDVLASVDFYVNKLGFRFDHYFDHINGGSVKEWTADEPPLYAEMWAGDQRFALHRASQPDSLSVGGTRIYFGVRDVRAHREAAIKAGVEAGDIIERSWMHMYRVVDPDGHELFIFARPPGWDQ